MASEESRSLLGPRNDDNLDDDAAAGADGRHTDYRTLDIDDVGDDDGLSSNRLWRPGDIEPVHTSVPAVNIDRQSRDVGGGDGGTNASNTLFEQRTRRLRHRVKRRLHDRDSRNRRHKRGGPAVAGDDLLPVTGRGGSSATMTTSASKTSSSRARSRKPDAEDVLYDPSDGDHHSGGDGDDRRRDDVSDSADDVLRTAQEPTRSLRRVVSYAICDSYVDFTRIIAFFTELPAHDAMVAEVLALYDDALHIKLRRQPVDVFVCSYGCVVVWNGDETLERAFIGRLHRFECGPHTKADFEDYDYCYGLESNVENDEITLAGADILEKLSISFALSQSTKMNSMEDRISRQLDENAGLPALLAATGHVGLSRLEINKRIGRMFVERNNVNLHFDVLQPPEFFWDNDTYKATYDTLFAYLELSERATILNKRLDLLHGLFEMLNTHLDSQRSQRLEWTLVALFAVCAIVFVLGHAFNKA